MTQPASDDATDSTRSADSTDGAEQPQAQPEQPTEPQRPTPTLLEQMGGPSGVVASVIPIVVFISVNTVASLTPAIWAAFGAAAVIAVFRMVRREAVQPAISGAFGVAVSAFIAYRMGEAKGFFLLGIWSSLVYGAVFAASVLVRWPLVGVLWHAVRGDGRRWRTDRAIVRGYDIATLTWTVVFGARFVVQRWLYDNDETGALGVARLAMGLPLTAVAAVVTIWAARRAGRMLDAAGETQPAEPTGGGEVGEAPNQPVR